MPSVWSGVILLVGFSVVRFPSPVKGYVRLENNFVVLTTRESGTFVGHKEELTSDLEVTGHRNNATAPVSLPKIYYAFRGIPYAKPPVGPLRWKDPELPDVTSGPKDATKFKSICPQWDDVKGQAVGNPDCLYLNIFTPRLHFTIGRGQGDELSPYDEDPRHSVRWLPVLVYVHSGDWISGSGDIFRYDPFLDENIVLVTFNYRLGVFGFLSSGNSLYSGNYGLLDQIACLKWIRRNIHRFGGDPNRVTLFGEVSALILSPLTSGLFQGVIHMDSPISVLSGGQLQSDVSAGQVQSHSDVSGGQVHLQGVNGGQSDPTFYTQLLESTGCSGAGAGAETGISDCLEIKTVDDLIRIQAEILEPEIFPGLIGPVVGNLSEVLPLTPNDLLRSPTFLNGTVPIMFGVNALEGFRPFQKFYKAHMERWNEIDIHQVKNSLRLALNSKFKNISNGAVEDIWKFYFGNYSSSNNNSQNAEFLQDQMLKLFGDLTAYTGHWELTESLSKRDATTFSYVFEPKVLNGANLVRSREFGNPVQNFPWEEEYFLFRENENLPEDPLYESYAKMSKVLVKIWTSFAAYRTPKSALAKEKSWGKWLPLTEDNPTSYYHLKLEGSRMKNNYRRQEVEFWKTPFSKVYPEDVHEKMEEKVKIREENDAKIKEFSFVESDNENVPKSSSNSCSIRLFSFLLFFVNLITLIIKIKF